MCRPQSEGGQRCAAHTRADMRAAEARYAATPSVDNYDTLQSARAEYAATPAGRRDLEERRAAASGTDAVDLDAALRRGEMIRDRNQAVRTATRTILTADQAWDPNASPEALERTYFATDNATLREMIVRNPNTPGAVLSDAFASDDRELRAIAAGNPSTPSDVIERATCDRDTLVRYKASMRLDLTEDQAMRLAEDPSFAVRQGVAANTPYPRVLDRLIRDPEGVEDVPLNPHASADHLARVYAASGGHVSRASMRLRVAQHPTVSADTLDRLSTEVSDPIQRHVAAHPNTGTETLERMARSGTYYIALAARFNLDSRGATTRASSEG